MQRIAQKILNKKIQSITQKNLTNGESITNRISLGKPGVYRYDVIFEDGSTQILAGKQKSRKIIFNGLRILSGKNLKIAFLLAKNYTVLGFNNSHLRETALYNNIAFSLKNYLIPIYGQYRNSFTDKYIILLKYIGEPRKITVKDYKTVFDTITDFHKEYYEQPLKAAELGVNCYSSKDYKHCKAALLEIFKRLEDENKKVFKPGQTEKIIEFLKNIDLEYLPFHRTLTHNDFSPRNMFFKDDRLYIYDWELACYQNPEHDLIEFLVSVLHEASDCLVREMISYFKGVLIEKLGIEIDELRYSQILRFNVLEYAGVRLTMLRLVNKKFKLPFIDQTVENMSRLMEFLQV